MCGIAGYIDFTKKSTPDLCRKMGNALVHRGPDDEGQFFEENESAQIGFAHQRLSIIDTSSAGHQPMKLTNESLVIVFNGEIYNYKEVKNTLENLGHNFSSNSDTEVVLYAWKQWGEACIDRFKGMFAFAVFDKIKNKVFLVRDRVGVKPLYLYQKGGLLLFGSELKALMQHPKFEKKIDISSTALYMQYGYYPEPYTVFEDCIKLKAGHLMTVDLSSQKATRTAYWSLTSHFYSSQNRNKPEEEVLEEVEQLLTQSFKHRMVADVPVGVFLSGGYDSTAVTALLQKGSNQQLNTFTIGFEEEKYNEAPHAKKVAEYLGTNHHEQYCTFEDAISLIPELSQTYDEPFADSSAIPTLLVSKMAVKNVKVALSADGGDELFSGYGKYKTFEKYAKQLGPFSGSGITSKAIGTISPLLPSKKMGYNFDRRLQRIKQLIKTGVSPINAMKIGSQNLTELELKQLFISEFEIDLTNPTNFDDCIHELKNGDTLNAMLLADFKTYLVDDILTKVDRATMSVGLEGREPMLDHELAEYLASVPYALKTKNNVPKYLLKSIVHKYAPKEIMERPKMGFAIPVRQWMRNELKDVLEETLSKEKVEAAGIFNYSFVKQLKSSYLAGRDEDFTPLWFLFIFQQWHEEWVG